MDDFFCNNILIGVRVSIFKNGSIPITEKKEPLQVLALKHKKDSCIEPHMHVSKKRVSNRLQECLIVKKGKIKLDLFGPDKKKFKSIHLKQGELFILLRGGYSISFLEDSEIFELKNGPFIDDKVLINKCG